MSDETFSKKLDKLLPKNFKENAESKTNDELLKEILKSSHVQADTEKDRDSDNKLATLREDVKLLSSAYKEVINCENAKIKYCLFLLKSRGGW